MKIVTTCAFVLALAASAYADTDDKTTLVLENGSAVILVDGMTLRECNAAVELLGLRRVPQLTSSGVLLQTYNGAGYSSPTPTSRIVTAKCVRPSDK